MKTKIVSDNKTGTFLRVNRIVAEQIFNEETCRLYVMTSDRNPVNSPTTAHEYKKGCMPYSSLNFLSVETFEDLIEDFTDWLDTDGYGHIPDHYRAKNELFSYWVKIEN